MKYADTTACVYMCLLIDSNQMVDYGKIRKDRKQGRKGGVNVRSEGGPPDMGALCI